jgi:crotonobetainyl-CoA:carnitine CoA-transferase CaiB-like acyl-CoA transferase
MAGMMSITGEPGREPQKAGVAISDIFTGLYSVIAIQAALRHAEATGEGQHIDMALLDTQISVLGNQNLNYLGLRQGARADGQRPHEHRALRGAAGEGRAHHPGRRQ